MIESKKHLLISSQPDQMPNGFPPASPDSFVLLFSLFGQIGLIYKGNLRDVITSHLKLSLTDRCFLLDVFPNIG